jgi:DNA-binding NarL/FixJ family response regulator
VSDPVRLVVADDQALVRAGFVMILETEPDIDVVGEAATGSQAVAIVAELRPDVVLMDVRMPEMDGLEAARIISSTVTDPPRIIMLTTFGLDDYVFEALRSGASGFLLKDTPPDDLVAAIRVVAAGDALLAPSVTRRLIEEFAARPQPTTTRPGMDLLTDRELEVLRHVARGMSNAEIAEALFVSETTIKSHVSHVLTKLAVRDRVQAVVAAYESGVVSPGA